MDRPFYLAALFADLPGEAVGDWSAARVAGVSIDSRRVRPGDLFVALPGEHADGTSFVADALRAGAVALVLPLGIELPAGVPALRMEDPRQFLPEIADRFFGRPSRSLRVHGVTGTNGKTTTAYMVSQVLGAAGHSVGYWTTNEVNTGRRRFRPVLTTPESTDLQGFLREVLDAGGSDACIEVSSHAVVQRRVVGVRFAVGVVTNVTPDHLDFHGDFGRYLEAKRAFVLALRPPAVCLYNVDDAGARAAAQGAAVRTLSYGFGPDADVRGFDAALGVAQARCRVCLSPAARRRVDLPREFAIEIPVPGRHNLQNALAAVATGLLQGVPVEVVRSALAAFRPAARRLCVQNVGPYAVIDDVAMNEGSYDAVFSTLAGARDGGIVVVNALRGHRGPEVNAGIASVLARWDRRLHFAPVVVTQSRAAVARYAVDYSVRPEELAAFVERARSEGLGCTLRDELDDAIQVAVSRLRPGDALVLLGTFGMDDGTALALRRLCEVTGLAVPPPRPTPEQSYGSGPNG